MSRWSSPRRTAALAAALVAAPLLVAAVPAAAAGDPDADARFTIAVLPDTQQEVTGVPGRFRERTRWLATARKDLDLRYVTHVGDVVNWDTPDHDQYERAATAARILDATGVPWSFGIGNHDSQATCEGGSACPGDTVARQRQTEVFNSYFGPHRADALTGTFEPGKIDNSYATFSAEGAEWLVLHLELWPRDEPIAWAQKVLADHPDHNVVVMTHSYLNADGSIKQDNGGYGANSPQHLWDVLLSQHANVRLVLSGHTGTTAHRVDTGVHGNEVHSILTAYHDNVGNPTRLLEVDVEAGSFSTLVHSSRTKRTFDDGSSFTATGLDWIR